MQGGCGSCYAVATTDMLNMRRRIRTKGRDQRLLSQQNVVSCSTYNQGCKGGYPFLVGKHAHDFGLLDSECQPYTQSDRTACVQGCSPLDPDPTRRGPHTNVTYAGDYRYVGGYYGACTERAMMEELYLRGPIVASINAPRSLIYYTGGIFSKARAAAKAAAAAKEWKGEPPAWYRPPPASPSPASSPPQRSSSPVVAPAAATTNASGVLASLSSNGGAGAGSGSGGRRRLLGDGDDVPASALDAALGGAAPGSSTSSTPGKGSDQWRWPRGHFGGGTVRPKEKSLENMELEWQQTNHGESAALVNDKTVPHQPSLLRHDDEPLSAFVLLLPRS